MRDPTEKPDPLALSAGDFRALRYLAFTWGAVIAGAWLVLDDDRARLLVTALDLGILAASLVTADLLRRWKKRR